jgi:hypothetical protein
MTLRDAAVFVWATVVVTPALGKPVSPDGGVRRATPVTPPAKAGTGTGTPGSKPEKGGPPLEEKQKRPTEADREVIEHLDLLLLLDLLSDWDLLDDDADAGAGRPPAPATPDGGATFRPPTGSKEYRP